MSISFETAPTTTGASAILTGTNRSETVSADLTIAHIDSPLGLESLIGQTLKWLTVEKCDATCTFRLKQTNGTYSGLFTADQGRALSQHDFVDILVSNPTGVGICRFVVGWSV